MNLFSRFVLTCPTRFALLAIVFSGLVRADAPFSPPFEWREANDGVGEREPLGFGMDSHRRLLVDHGSVSKLWDLESREKIATLTKFEFYEPDQDVVVDFSESGYIEVRNSSNGAVVYHYEFEYNDGYNDGLPLRVWFSGGGRRCHANLYEHGLITFELANGEVLWQGELFRSYRGLPGSDHLLSYEIVLENWYSNVARLCDLLIVAAETGEAIAERSEGCSSWVKSSDEKSPHLILVDELGDVSLMDKDLGQTTPLDLGDWKLPGYQIAISRDGAICAAVVSAKSDEVDETEERLRVWDFQDGGSWEIELSDINIKNIGNLTMSADGSKLYFGAQPYVVLEYDISAKELVTLVTLEDDQLAQIALIDEGRRVLVNTHFGSLLIFDAVSREEIYRGEYLIPSQPNFQDLNASIFAEEDGSFFYLASDATVAMVDLESGTVINRFPERSDVVATWSETGNSGEMRAFFWDGSTQIYDAGDAELVGVRTTILPVGARVFDHDEAAGLVLVEADGLKLYRLADGSLAQDLSEIEETFPKSFTSASSNGYPMFVKTMGARLLQGGSVVLLSDEGGNRVISFYESESGEELYSISGTVWQAAEGGVLVTIYGNISLEGDSYSRSRILLIDTEGYQIADTIEWSHYVNAQLSSDGRYVATLEIQHDAVPPHYIGPINAVLNEYAVTPSGFARIQETEWVKGGVYLEEANDHYSTFVHYEGPNSLVATVPVDETLVDFRSGMEAKFERREYDEIVHVAEAGHLLLRSRDSRLRQLDLIRRAPVELDLDIEQDSVGKVLLEDSGTERTVLEVSRDLISWEVRGSLLVPVSATPWFFRAYGVERSGFPNSN